MLIFWRRTSHSIRNRNWYSCFSYFSSLSVQINKSRRSSHESKLHSESSIECCREKYTKPTPFISFIPISLFSIECCQVHRNGRLEHSERGTTTEFRSDTINWHFTSLEAFDNLVGRSSRSDNLLKGNHGLTVPVI